jgi:hypothetical protein
MLQPKAALGAVAGCFYEVDAGKKEDETDDKRDHRVHFAEVQAADPEKAHSAHDDADDAQNGENAAESAFLVHEKEGEKVVKEKRKDRLKRSFWPYT